MMMVDAQRASLYDANLVRVCVCVLYTAVDGINHDPPLTRSRSMPSSCW